MGELIVVMLCAFSVIILAVTLIKVEERLEDQEDRISRLAKYVFDRDSKKDRRS